VTSAEAKISSHFSDRSAAIFDDESLAAKKSPFNICLLRIKMATKPASRFCHLLALTADLRDTAHRGRSEPVNFRDLLP
jgi:hypothetical protein